MTLKRVEAYETRESSKWFSAERGDLKLGDLRAILDECDDLDDEAAVQVAAVSESWDKSGLTFSKLNVRWSRNA